MTYLARALLAALSLVLPGVSFCAAEAPPAFKTVLFSVTVWLMESIERIVADSPSGPVN